MAAADFWRFIPTSYDAGSPKANHQISPGITHSLSRLCLSDIRHGVSVQVLGFADICPLTLPCRLYPLPVRQASALPTASSRFHLTMDTLAVQLTLPLAGCVEDLHLLVSAPCRAHKEEKGKSTGLSPFGRFDCMNALSLPEPPRITCKGGSSFFSFVCMSLHRNPPFSSLTRSGNPTKVTQEFRIEAPNPAIENRAQTALPAATPEAQAH
jgi:hypothetical protein